MKIYFVDFWKGFDVNDNFFINRMRMLEPNITLDSVKPDFLFCSSFGNDHLRYDDCVKIYFTGENDVPDFNLYDYAMSFHHLSFGDRHLRFPLYVLYKGFDRLANKSFDEHELLSRKFCNFVYSNAAWADPIRDAFFHELSKYKRIDSGGRHMNNIGSPVADKMEFIKNYKFTIAFENSSLPGYTTEKIMEPMVVNSMPIYWGNPDVSLDFNINSFVNVPGKDDMGAVIDEIIRLDSDDDYYLHKMSEAWVLENMRMEDWLSRFDAFMLSIIGQSFDKIRRCSRYGFAKRYRQRAMTRDRLLKLFFWIRNK